MCCIHIHGFVGVNINVANSSVNDGDKTAASLEI